LCLCGQFMSDFCSCRVSVGSFCPIFARVVSLWAVFVWFLVIFSLFDYFLTHLRTNWGSLPIFAAQRCYMIQLYNGATHIHSWITFVLSHSHETRLLHRDHDKILKRFPSFSRASCETQKSKILLHPVSSQKTTHLPRLRASLRWRSS